MATKKAPENKKLEKTTIMLRYNFTKEELQDKAQSLGEAVQKLVQIEEELSTIKSDYKKKLTEKQSQINELSNHITTKYEMRNTPCFLHKNFKAKERQYLTHDGELLKAEPLTVADMQLAIDVSEKDNNKK